MPTESAPTDSHPRTLDAAGVAAAVAKASREALAEGLRGDHREAVLDEVFRRMEEHFDADKAGDLKAIVEWRIGGRADGGDDRYQVRVDGGRCRVRKGGGEPANVTLELAAADFMKLVTGKVGGPQLFMTGRLRIYGDLVFAVRLTSLFRIPEPPSG